MNRPLEKSAPGARVIVIAITLIAIAVVFFLPRMAQDPAYHNFADQRSLLGIPNFLNVISNLPFAFVGVLGLRALLGKRTGATISFLDARERWPYVVFFLGVALTSIGSSYYHLAPDNERLVWDRLPMTLGFMSIFAAVISERVALTLGRRLLIPLLALGLVSVLYWQLSERDGAGDLRLYGIVQFYPLVMIPLMLAMFPPRYTRGADMVYALILYGGAKVLELMDAMIFSAGQIISGHSLKHVTAAAASYWILVMLKKREILAHSTEPAYPASSEK